MGRIHSTNIVTSNLELSFDFANPKNWNREANTISTEFTSTKGIRTPVVWEIVNPQYVNFDLTNNAVIFTRNTAASLNVASKNVAGGCIRTNGNLYQTGANTITYTGFYYQDHTFEVWFKIINPAPSNYDGTETRSVLVSHRGYNNGFGYSSTAMEYSVWNSGTSGNNVLTWTIGAASEIRANQWYQIVAKRSGNTFTRYLNGANLSSTVESPAINSLNGFLGELCIGATWRPTTNFEWFGVNSVSNFRMYSRALTDAEILQNFNAYRGRFGI